MKVIHFKNKLNGEKYICLNTKKIQIIDDIEFLSVRRPNSEREFLVRKDFLEKIHDIKHKI